MNKKVKIKALQSENKSEKTVKKALQSENKSENSEIKMRKQ